MENDESTNAEQQIVSRLRTRRIPLLRPNAYGCVVRLRSFDDTGIELDACVKDLANAAMFEFPMEFCEKIELDSTGASRPSPEDFESEAEYDEAADAVLEKYDRALPWCQERADLETQIRALLNWSLNDKDYVYQHANGELEQIDVTFDRTQRCWTSRNTGQLHLFTELEDRHRVAIDDIVNDVKKLVSGSELAIYQAEHLLVDGEAYGWICFFDEALAIATSRHVILLWAGFDGWYG